MEALERENYLQAVAREQMIPAEELRGLVNRMGMSMGLKAGESLNHSGRVVPQETQEESGGSGLSGSRKPRRPDKEDGIRRSQRLLLTWLIETPALFEKIEGIITADDFVEHLYHQVAQMVFDGHREGNLNPAAILSRFINDEDQYKEVAALFNASLKESLNNEEQKEGIFGDCDEGQKEQPGCGQPQCKGYNPVTGDYQAAGSLKAAAHLPGLTAFHRKDGPSYGRDGRV